jgi:serine protease Do
VPVDIVRDKKRKTIKVKVGGLDSDDSYSLAAGDTDEGRGGRLGVVVEDVSADNLERFGINGGVVVRELVPGSVAAEAGIRVGDVITLIDNSPIKSTQAFDKAVSGLRSGASVPLRLIRRGSPMFIGLKLED